MIEPGTGLLIAIDNDDETPPPGAGLTAVMPSDPALARSADVSATVMAVALTSVVGRDAPLTRMPVPATKPVPTMLTIVAADPAARAVRSRHQQRLVTEACVRGAQRFAHLVRLDELGRFHCRVEQR